LTSGEQLAAGNTTVYVWLYTNESAGDQTINLTLYAGSASGGWTNLGSKAWEENTAGMTELLSTSFATSGYTFGTDERLRVFFDMPAGSQARIHWDGDQSDSRVELP
jgi:hypothetical protein